MNTLSFDLALVCRRRPAPLLLVRGWMRRDMQCARRRVDEPAADACRGGEVRSTPPPLEGRTDELDPTGRRPIQPNHHQRPFVLAAPDRYSPVRPSAPSFDSAQARSRTVRLPALGPSDASPGTCPTPTRRPARPALPPVLAPSLPPLQAPLSLPLRWCSCVLVLLTRALLQLLTTLSTTAARRRRRRSRESQTACPWRPASTRSRCVPFVAPLLPCLGSVPRR